MKRLLLVCLAAAWTWQCSPAPPPAAPAGPAAGDTALERQVLYHPSHEEMGSRPEGVEEIRLVASDGVELAGWYLPPEPHGQVVVFYHGNGGNVTLLGPLFEVYRSLHLGALAVDYRGYGQSQGEPDEQGLYRDGLAAWEEAVRRGTPPERLVIHGYSLGGGVATSVAAQKPCSGLILESTFTSAGEVARLKDPNLGRMVNAFDSLPRLKEIHAPVLVIHGSEDDLIPSSMGRRLHQAAPGSEFWLVEGAGHGGCREVGGEEYARHLGSFCTQLEGQGGPGGAAQKE